MAHSSSTTYKQPLICVHMPLCFAWTTLNKQHGLDRWQAAVRGSSRGQLGSRSHGCRCARCIVPASEPIGHSLAALVPIFVSLAFRRSSVHVATALSRITWPSFCQLLFLSTCSLLCTIHLTLARSTCQPRSVPHRVHGSKLPGDR